MGSRNGGDRAAGSILVTGVPRSGTTWLARLLASSPHTSMPGREPMNPRGKQFRLGGHVDAWVRRTSFDAREAAVLRRCYAGREPRTFSRYGIRQWAAPLRSTRIVIKDPFALLSIAGVHEATGATPVLVYRHPGAVLVSYRRMGWSADTEELAALGAPTPAGPGDLEAMLAMWTWCHEIALSDLADVDEAVVVSHHALTVGGRPAQDLLRDRLSLAHPAEEADSVEGDASAAHAGARAEPRDGVLHDFSRSATDVDTGWKKHLETDEVQAIEAAVSDVWGELERRQLPLMKSPPMDEPTSRKESP